MKVSLTSKKEVFNDCKAYVIAELGSNHNGDMALAEKMIIKAKAAGVDCVKFQSWTKETLFSKKVYDENYFLADDYRNRSDYSLEKIVEQFSISEQELVKMKGLAEKLEIEIVCTPFSTHEADFLVDLQVSPDGRSLLVHASQGLVLVPIPPP